MVALFVVEFFDQGMNLVWVKVIRYGNIETIFPRQSPGGVTPVDSELTRAVRQKENGQTRGIHPGVRRDLRQSAAPISDRCSKNESVHARICSFPGRIRFVHLTGRRQKSTEPSAFPPRIAWARGMVCPSQARFTSFRSPYTISVPVFSPSSS